MGKSGIIILLKESSLWRLDSRLRTIPKMFRFLIGFNLEGEL
jgi:hypothetical protein